jgi:hypothetical protein
LGAVCVKDLMDGGGDEVLCAGERLRVDRFALLLTVGRFQYVADPNPLDERGSIGRSDVYAYVCAKTNLISVFCVDFPAVFVVLSLKQCRNELPPAVTILLC